MQPKYGSTSLCDQNCGVQPADRHTTHATRTDKSLKTEGPKILSNDIFYFRTVIIGGPMIPLVPSLSFGLGLDSGNSRIGKIPGN